MKKSDQRVEMRKMNSKLLGKKIISRKREQPVQMSCGRSRYLKWERVRKAAVARAERADGTWSEVRMGPSAGPCCIGPGEDFVFIWRVLGSQGRVSHREVLLRSVRWSHWCGEFSSGCERWLGGRVGAAGRLKGTAWWAGGEEIRHQEFKYCWDCFSEFFGY